jgi:hypothetical protein
VPGIRRSVQCHITGTRTRADISETELEIDGIAELWYDDVEALRRSAATAKARQLYADGALLIGPIKVFITEKREIIDLS